LKRLFYKHIDLFVKFLQPKNNKIYKQYYEDHMEKEETPSQDCPN
ncbi:6794_t:CDS:1, partial [Cetraspora pellucida]